jgi:hypothetical protein
MYGVWLYTGACGAVWPSSLAFSSASGSRSAPIESPASVNRLAREAWTRGEWGIGHRHEDRGAARERPWFVDSAGARKRAPSRPLPRRHGLERDRPRAVVRGRGWREAREAETLQLETLGGRTSAPWATLASLRVGGAEIRNADVVVHHPGDAIDGILGNSFLARWDVSVDPDRRLLKLRSLQPAAAVYASPR